MDFRLCHVGEFRQYSLELGDQIALSARLHVPPPLSTEEKELHTNIPGSPYSTTPGRISLAEAAEEAKQRDQETEQPRRSERGSGASASKDPKEDDVVEDDVRAPQGSKPSASAGKK